MNKQSRNPQLDRLRAVAVLIVILVHLHGHASPDSALSVVETGLRRIGLVGVDMFFVLSGFLIGTLLLTEMNDHSRINIPRFITRRGFKLYPVYYVFLAYCMVREVMKAHQGGTAFHSAMGETFHRFLSSIFFVQNYIPPSPAGHTWSLAVEEHFYLTLPLVLSWLGPKRVWKWLIPIGLSTVPLCLGLRIITAYRQEAGLTFHSGLDFNMGFTQLRIDALMIGVVLAVVALKSPALFQKMGRYPKTLVAAGVGLWMIAILPLHWAYYWATVGFTLRIAGSAAILVGACSQGGSGAPKRGMMAWIGFNSYAIYVWHTTAMGITENALGGFVTAHVPNVNLRWILMSILIIASAVLAGVIATRLVEKPALTLRDKWFPSRGRTISAGPIMPSASAALETPNKRVSAASESLLAQAQGGKSLPAIETLPNG